VTRCGKNHDEKIKKIKILNKINFNRIINGNMSNSFSQKKKKGKPLKMAYKGRNM
jgi:hypothetical protein